MKRTIYITCLFVGIFVVMAFPALAIQYTFDNITNNNPDNAAIGEAQLFMDVTEKDGRVLFEFTNIGSEASSITDIYFDDDVPLLIYHSFIYNTTGVEFTVGATPGDLPGGQSYNFTSNHSYDSDNPPPKKGVNPGESLGILFALNNISFNDVIEALNESSLRVGIHVQDFASGGSESFIHSPNSPEPPIPPNPDPIPEPSTVFLMGLGLLGLLGLGRKFRK